MADEDFLKLIFLYFSKYYIIISRTDDLPERIPEMYLVSLYFDTKTDNKIRNFIKLVARKSGNLFMIEEKVPPHITVAAVEATDEEQLVKCLHEVCTSMKSGQITWASVGTFLPYVIYIAPILNQYLHEVSVQLNSKLATLDGVKLRQNYQPFGWIPHTTIAKKLSSEEMRTAFEVLQSSFGVMEGESVRIGLAKTNPYREIASWDLKESQ